MMDGLNKYGLGVKYAIIGLVGGAIGAVLVAVFGQESGSNSFLIFPIAGAVGGYVGGRLRQKRGKED
jgi:uncharacterized membrane protein YeaQ/YmgE (transglycosylase-associated protein family)